MKAQEPALGAPHWDADEHDVKRPYSGFIASITNQGEFWMCGYELTPYAACQFAQWILDTFDEPRPALRRDGGG